MNSPACGRAVTDPIHLTIAVVSMTEYVSKAWGQALPVIEEVTLQAAAQVACLREGKACTYSRILHEQAACASQACLQCGGAASSMTARLPASVMVMTMQHGPLMVAVPFGYCTGCKVWFVEELSCGQCQNINSNLAILLLSVDLFMSDNFHLCFVFNRRPFACEQPSWIASLGSPCLLMTSPTRQVLLLN